MEVVTSFAPDALRRFPQARRHSPDGLAERVGIARLNLIAYEKSTSGRAPNRLRALAAALGVDAMRLVTVMAPAATLADLRAVTGRPTTTETPAALGVPRERIEAGRRPLDDETAQRLAELVDVAPSAVVAAHQRGSASGP